MNKIEVDDEVYACLENRARGFADTPNSVLRRVFKLDVPGSPAAARPDMSARGSKAPKADLGKLVESGLLQDGQWLHLRDYRGDSHDVRAQIRGNQLEYRGRRASMSALAAECMQALGHKSGAYRGPSFWFTDDGRSIKELWDDWLLDHRS